MVDDAQNKESMKGAIETLEQITSSNSTPKTVKKSLTDLIIELKNKNIHYQLEQQILSVY